MSHRNLTDSSAKSRPDSNKTWFRPPRLAVLFAAAAIPIYPALTIAAAAAYTAFLLLTRPTHLRAPTGLRYVWVLAILGCGAQLLSHTLLVPAPPLATTIDVPFGIDAYSSGNLIFNSDLAGMQSWRSGQGLGPFAEAIEPAVWRLSVVDGQERFTEARNRQEVLLPAGVPYSARAVIRHDGTEFSGRLVFRARDGWRAATTSTQELAPGLVLLEGVLPELEAPTRMRTFHIADLAGDWTYIDIALVSLREGELAGSEAFVPHNPLTLLRDGIWWWLGLALMLTTCGIAAHSLRSLGYQSMFSIGIICGLAVQLLIVMGQLLAGQGGRPTGSLWDPNLLAHAAVIAGLASVASARRTARTAGIAAAVVTPIVVMSGSDAGLVGLGAGALLVAAALMRRRRSLLLSVTAVSLALAVLLGGAKVWELLESDTNNVARLQAWESVVSLASEYPLAGVGTGNFSYHYEFAVPAERGPRYRNHHAHTLLGVAAESGLPVALTVIGGLLLLLVGYYRANRPLIGAILAVALLINQVDLTLFNPAVLLPWWMVHASAVSDEDSDWG